MKFRDLYGNRTSQWTPGVLIAKYGSTSLGPRGPQRLRLFKVLALSMNLILHEYCFLVLLTYNISTRI